MYNICGDGDDDGYDDDDYRDDGYDEDLFVCITRSWIWFAFDPKYWTVRVFAGA